MLVITRPTNGKGERISKMLNKNNNNSNLPQTMLNCRIDCHQCTYWRSTALFAQYNSYSHRLQTFVFWRTRDPFTTKITITETASIFGVL